MKQVLQHLNTGLTEVVDLPSPRIKEGHLLIQTTRSLVSAGTERMLVDFGRSGWIEKARQQPERVRQVLEKARTDGLVATWDAVRSKLDEPLALGYCNVGIVAEVGDGVTGFSIGDRVASNGPHAEIVSVPKNLCARIPDEVSDDEAAFTVVGAIALHGVRLARPTLGECFVVMGLGLIGLLTVQLLRAHGCRVLGIDPDPGKAKWARDFGAEIVDLEQAEDPVEVAMAFSRGRGVDGVLLTLASKSHEPIRQAARMCRKRGRIVLVGVTGLHLNRSDFYEKEISFQVSASYGPGRYDPNYEDKGQDYPIGFVRWTAQRNFEAVLDMMAGNSLDVKPLITHRFPLEEAPKAYDLLAKGNEPYLGILLEYPGAVRLEDRTIVLKDTNQSSSSTVSPTSPAARAPKAGAENEVKLGVIGAGNFAGRVLIPAFRKTGASLVALANTGGVTGLHYAKRHGFEKVTTDVEKLMLDENINAVVVATRHDSHAKLVVRALQAGKHVFCEKPLALTLRELEEIRAVWEARPENKRPVLMVGFNRRFAPMVQHVRKLLAAVRQPKTFIVTVNAGDIPADHWTQDPAVGGGRLIGEACHFIDLLRFLAQAPITDWCVRTIGGENRALIRDDKATITLTFADGSMGTIHYFANGHKSFPKERIEVFGGGRILQLDNFRALHQFGWSGRRTMRQWRQDKGHVAGAQAFVDAVRKGGAAPIPFEELIEVSRVSIEVGEAAREWASERHLKRRS